jgi:hypothetical protein
MADMDLKTPGADNTAVPDTEKGHEEKHEGRLMHLIHGIEDEVKHIFDIDSFVNTHGNITGGITGATDDELTDED